MLKKLSEQIRWRRIFFVFFASPHALSVERYMGQVSQQHYSRTTTGRTAD